MFDKTISQNRDYFSFRLSLLKEQLDRCREQLASVDEKDRNPTQEGNAIRKIANKHFNI